MAEPGEVSAWSVNPDRTLILLKVAGAPVRLECLRLDRAGRVLGAVTGWTPGDATGDWDILGWAGTSRVALCRQHPNRTELRIVDVRDSSAEPVRHDVLGRPLACRTNRSGEVELLLAVSHGARTVLCSYRPDSGSYLLLAESGGLRGVAAWDVDAGLVVATLERAPGQDGAVRMFGWDGAGYAELDVHWPAGVTAVSAAGYAGDVVGLTGVDAAGHRVPGVLRLADRAVRWFAEHPGYASVDVAPSGEHVLVASWIDEAFRYRVLDDAGNATGELTPAGLATRACFTQDGLHLIGSFSSPASPPAPSRWLWRDSEWLPLRPRPARPAVVRWRHRWVPDEEFGRLPEWEFEPGSDSRGTVLHLHGGPRLGQEYEPVIATLAGRGWSVVGLNYPGSSGYGTQYRERTRGDWGGADAGAVERRLWSLHERTGRPVCLYGHGYGGYLALLVASRAPRLLAGVAVYGPVVDLIKVLAGATGRRQEWLAWELGELRYQPRELETRSPVSRLTGLAETALLVGHGRQDAHCPVGQSRQLVRLLDMRPRAGGFLRYLEDPDGTHVPSSWRSWTEAVAAHFDQAAAGLVRAGAAS